jgi:hypothetical protein
MDNATALVPACIKQADDNEPAGPDGRRGGDTNIVRRLPPMRRHKRFPSVLRKALVPPIFELEAFKLHSRQDFAQRMPILFP